jgi:hypothetical protein
MFYIALIDGVVVWIEKDVSEAVVAYLRYPLWICP